MPTYDAKVADDVPYLDVAAVQSADGKTVAFFMVNRHPDEAMTVDIDMAGFAPKAIAEHITIAHPDLRATNTAAKPDRVVPKAGRGDFGQRRRRQRQSCRAVMSCGARQRLSSLPAPNMYIVCYDIYHEFG